MAVFDQDTTILVLSAVAQDQAPHTIIIKGLVALPEVVRRSTSIYLQQARPADDRAQS